MHDSGNEGYDPNVIFTSDEDDNIFDDIVDNNTMGYYDRMMSCKLLVRQHQLSHSNHCHGLQEKTLDLWFK